MHTALVWEWNSLTRKWLTHVRPVIGGVFLSEVVLGSSIELVIKMIPDKAPGEDVLHASWELKKDAHVPSFEKYKELYIKSVESPGGEYHWAAH